MADTACRMRSAVLLLAAALSGACASTGAVPRPFPTPRSSSPGSSAPPPASVSAPASPAGYAIAGTAIAMRGAPYRSGGADPTGFDCSGLVQYVFAQHGIRMPRTVSELAHEGWEVDARTLEPGDLLFFWIDSSKPSHVAIAVGGDAFVHAPNARGEVRVERLSAGYWTDRLTQTRRIVAAPPASTLSR